MSRAHDARRKAERRQRRVEGSQDERADATLRSGRLFHLIPVGVILGIFAVVGFVGFGGSGASDRQGAPPDVSALLSGIPQDGSTLGSPEAPMTVVVFADLECPTVALFATAYLPSIIETWVRNGEIKLVYRSLRTDTYDERTFFRQEAAALAAGRQDKLWNYALTFIYQQGPTHTDYANEEFLTHIASQVPGLRSSRWQRVRDEASLATQVASELHYAQVRDLRFTPSFLMAVDEPQRGQTSSPVLEATRQRLKASLGSIVDVLAEESAGDIPSLTELQSRGAS